MALISEFQKTLNFHSVHCISGQLSNDILGGFFYFFMSNLLSTRYVLLDELPLSVPLLDVFPFPIVLVKKVGRHLLS